MRSRLRSRVPGLGGSCSPARPRRKDTPRDGVPPAREAAADDRVGAGHTGAGTIPWLRSRRYSRPNRRRHRLGVTRSAARALVESCGDRSLMLLVDDARRLDGPHRPSSTIRAQPESVRRHDHAFGSGHVQYDRALWKTNGSPHRRASARPPDAERPLSVRAAAATWTSRRAPVVAIERRQSTPAPRATARRPGDEPAGQPTPRLAARRSARRKRRA